MHGHTTGNADSDSRYFTSTFFINEQIDTGAIIAQRKTPIGMQMSAGELHDELKDIGAQLTVETVDQIAQGKVPTILQDPNDQNLPHAPKIFKADCEIDWKEEAQLNHNRIRGLSPYPAAWCKLWSKKKATWITFKLFGSDVITDVIAIRNDGPFSQPNGIVFPSGKGFVCIKEIQAEGKKRMDYKAFLAGNDLFDLAFNA